LKDRPASTEVDPQGTYPRGRRPDHRRWAGRSAASVHRTPGTERPDLKAAILIIDSFLGDAFARAKILMCADTLSAAVAIRAWREAHGILVAG
jgi:hypothetical protein